MTHLTFSDYFTTIMIPAGSIAAVYALVTTMSNDFFAGRETLWFQDITHHRRFNFHDPGRRADELRFHLRLFATGLLWFVSVLSFAFCMYSFGCFPVEEETVSRIAVLFNIPSVIVVIYIAYIVRLSVLIKSRILE